MEDLRNLPDLSEEFVEAPAFRVVEWKLNLHILKSMLCFLAVHFFMWLFSVVFRTPDLFGPRQGYGIYLSDNQVFWSSVFVFNLLFLQCLAFIYSNNDDYHISYELLNEIEGEEDEDDYREERDDNEEDDDAVDNTEEICTCPQDHYEATEQDDNEESYESQSNTSVTTDNAEDLTDSITEDGSFTTEDSSSDVDTEETSESSCTCGAHLSANQFYAYTRTETHSAVSENADNSVEVPTAEVDSDSEQSIGESFDWIDEWTVVQENTNDIL